LQRAGVLGPHDLHALSGQALELLELALVKLESSDSLKLTHGSGLQTSGLLAEIDVLGCPGERQPRSSSAPFDCALHGTHRSAAAERSNPGIP
jgi:hypothetical protein